MKHFFLYFLAVFLCFGASAQVLPQEKIANWQLAGKRQTLETPDKFIDFGKYGAVADGITANDSAMQAILALLKDDSAVIYFPNGKYFFTKSIKLGSNIVMRGQSNDSAKLIFRLRNADALIKAEGTLSKIQTEITADIYKDSLAFTVADASKFASGDFIKLVEDDSYLITSGWAKGHTGQIIKIKDISGNTIRLASPLRRSYHISNGVKMIKILPVSNVSIENFSLERQDKTTAQTSNILLKYATGCVVKCVQSYNCNFSHIELNNCTNIEISGNYLHHALDYGDGGKGYGVLVHYTSGENLVQNNIFNNLRHSMLLQGGANGNVFAYNYSINPVWSETFLPKNSAGDIVLHGNYPYANLFEGNVVQNIVIDNSHGKNGPDNTFFRNRVELYGIVMNGNAGNNQNFIANEITNKGLFMGNLTLTGSGNINYANNRLGNVTVKEDTLSNSLFLDEKPAYYTNASSWPPIGYPNLISSNTIQAEAFFGKGIYTPCSIMETPHNDTITINDTIIPKDTTLVKDSIITGIFMNKMQDANLKVYPNPADDFVKIVLQENNGLYIEEIKLLSVTGQEIITSNKNIIDTKNLSSGMYFLCIRFADDSIVMRRLMKR